jgi:hypothetical protein
MEEYKSGDWGIASFRWTKKGAVRGITAYGQIKAVERNVILFEDDLQEYVVEKKKFKFEKIVH